MQLILAFLRIAEAYLKPFRSNFLHTSWYWLLQAVMYIPRKSVIVFTLHVLLCHIHQDTNWRNLSLLPYAIPNSYIRSLLIFSRLHLVSLPSSYYICLFLLRILYFLSKCHLCVTNPWKLALTYYNILWNLVEVSGRLCKTVECCERQ